MVAVCTNIKELPGSPTVNVSIIIVILLILIKENNLMPFHQQKNGGLLNII
jgi:hypothetical protein